MLKMLLIAFAVSVGHSQEPDKGELDKQILKLQPQADKNGDGKLSKAEEATLSKMILNRSRRADTDGDHVLSVEEILAVLRRAAARAKRQVRQKPSAKRDYVEGEQAPTYANVKYGDHERNVFDIWLADSPRPTPLAIYIHGVGLRAGSKERLDPAEREKLLEAGISVAAINYRYLSTATPKPSPYSDARRALQLMGYKASEWNLDKAKVAAFGGSAGAQFCMWLAFADDMAKPNSEDPIGRESTRLTCVATSGGQTDTSPEFWLKTIGPLLGDEQKIESLARRDSEKARIAKWGAKTLEDANEIASRHTPLFIVSPDDPPIFMSYSMSPTAKLPTDPKRIRGWLIHHVNFGIALKEKSDAIKHEAYLNYPGADIEYQSQVEFFVDKLRKKER